MTVCVAAICDDNKVVGAADRMLTSGSIQFQPEQTKLVQLTSSIVAMIAGDMSVHAELLAKVQRSINDRIAAEPNNWWSVADIASLYESEYSRLRRRLAERDLLEPLGLDLDSYIGRQRELSGDLVSKIATELINYQLPVTELIFAGVDEGGPHIYSVGNGKATCQDGVGFAAIGVGSWHASSQLMVAGHTRKAPLSRSVYLTFAAKKRAEIAPGVGTETDMFLIGPTLGSYIEIRHTVIEEFGRFYEDHRSKTQELVTVVERNVHEYLEGLSAQRAEQAAQSAEPAESAAAEVTDRPPPVTTSTSRE